MKRPPLLTLLALPLLSASCLHHKATTAYYTTSYPAYELSCLPVQGGEPTLLAKKLHIDALVYDPTAGNLLTWESGWGFGIMRRELDGTSVGRIASDAQARDYAIDLSKRHLYFVAWGRPPASSEGTIERIDLADGGNHCSMTGPEFKNAAAIAIDPRRKKLYWTANYEGSRVWRANLDGSEREQIGPDIETNGVAVDSLEGWIFFHERTVKSRGLWRCRPDGNDARPIIPLAPYTHIHKLTVDSVGRKLYWIESTWPPKTAAIRRSDMDGRHVETVFEQNAKSETIRTFTLGPDPQVK